MKKFILIVLAIIIIIIGVNYVSKGKKTVTQTPQQLATTTQTTATTTADNKPTTVIGKTAGGHDIVAYHFGTGSDEVVFVGGLHGGYEWNTVRVAQELIDYVKAHPDTVPANVKLTVIPVVNVDGLQKVTGTTDGNFSKEDVSASQDTVIAGRFNANNVDLNRNFACDWQATGTWQNKKVSGGTAEFSEPESLAIKSYITDTMPKAVVAWYSSAGGVYASNCHNGVSTETRTIMNTFAKASGYPAHDDFNFYEVTGDMTNWLAKINVPAISVLLTNHTDTEWTKNFAGVKAVLEYYAE